MPLKAIAYDPGITTGWALGEIDEIAGLMLVTSGQDKWSVLEFMNELQTQDPDFIIYESFEFRQKARDKVELFSRELIGILNLYAQMNQKKTFKQSPGVILNQYFNRKKLKEDMLWINNHIHANEACMHLLHWYTFGAGYQYNTEGYKPTWTQIGK